MCGLDYASIHILFYWRCIVISTKNAHMINEEIKATEVRLKDENGEMVGIVPLQEALDKAAEADLDLVCIAPQAKPPVCEIKNYGKFLFEQAKREKEAKKNQKVINVKEIKLSPSIEAHDVSYKIKNARKFLKDGDKVKVSVRFRGREMNYTALGEKVLVEFAEQLTDIGSVDKKPKLEGRNMIMIISPKNDK